MKRIGPELKMPDLKNVKAPGFLADIYYDLRERRLLPLVALVVVATAAVPFLLGSGAEESALPAAGVPAGAEEEVAAGSTLTVVEANPGLRDYRKRLRGRTPSDPFVQKYTSVPPTSQLESTGSEKGAATGGGGGGGSATITVEKPEGATADPEAPSSGGGGGGKVTSSPADDGGSADGGSGGGLEGKRLFGYRPDVRFGVAGSEDLHTYEELPLGSLLPKKKAVLLFVGVTQNGKRALFSVTPEIAYVRGDGDCIGGRRNCQILSLQVGQAADLVTSTPGRVFRLKVTDIDFVELPLPKTKKSKRASDSSSGGGGHGWADAVGP